ncbi:MAG: DUF928 domain-containing protein [Synechococcales bacterium]|nr:DUF928 domain-containing protein [Synechococcales bacterium]
MMRLNPMFRPKNKLLIMIPGIALSGAIAFVELLPGTPFQPLASSAATPTVIQLSQRSRLTRAKPPAKPRKRLNWRVSVRPTGYRQGAIARSAICAQPEKTLTAIVPAPQVGESLDRNSLPVDYSSRDYPTVWMHVPATTPGTAAHLTVQQATGDKTRRQIYSTPLILSGQSGFIGVQLPRSLPAMQVGQRYLWQLRLPCGNPNKPETHPVIGGWIERVDPQQLAQQQGKPTEFLQQLAIAPTTEIPLLYAELGIWQDVLTGLAELRLNNPTDRQITQDWQDLLSQTGMEALASSPVLKIF